jgi:undecaprenyl-diphosphatase
MGISMDLLNAIIMGVVQGIAEFLPISSDGHLALMSNILHMNADTGLLFNVMLHFGTLVAVCIAFWKDILELICEGFKLIGDCLVNIGRFINQPNDQKKVNYKQVLSTPYRRFVMLVIVSTIPTGLIGILFKDLIEGISNNVLITGMCLILTGMSLIIADRAKEGTKNDANASYTEAGVIGVAQGLAILPGLSRSGCTITASLLLGFDRDFAVKYSFIMSIPAILGAVVLEVKDFSMDMVTQNQLMNYMVGTVIAAAVGFFAIKTMLVIVRGKKFKYFAYYCFAVGVLAILWYLK